MDEPRKRFAAMMAGLDIHYDLGDGHSLLGRHMPDLELVTPDGPLRAFTLLHDWADRVQLIDAKYAGTWGLPASWVVPVPTEVLIWPDGCMANER